MTTTEPRAPRRRAAPRIGEDVSIHGHGVDTPSLAQLVWQRVRSLPAIIAVLVVATLVLTPWLAWELSRPRVTRLLIVDKTVPVPEYGEHSLLTWYLGHQKRVTPSGQPWVAERDYVGFDPQRCKGETITRSALEGTKLLYVTDAYGVYTADYEVPRDLQWVRDCGKQRRAERDEDERRRALAAQQGVDPGEAPPVSPLIYGGVSVDEVAAMRDFYEHGGSVVAEFNTLETPTFPGAAHDALADLVGARYLSWLCRWYPDLGSKSEVQARLVKRWEAKTGRKWDFHGPGVIYFGEVGDDRIVVVGEEMLASREAAVTFELAAPSDPLMRGVRTHVPYGFWAPGVEPVGDADVLANWQVHLTKAGQELVREDGFPLRFPAVVRRPGRPLAAYLAGEWADPGEPSLRFQHTLLLDPAQAWLARLRSGASTDEDFTWNVAFPMWTNMFRMSGAG